MLRITLLAIFVILTGAWVAGMASHAIEEAALQAQIEARFEQPSADQIAAEANAMPDPPPSPAPVYANEADRLAAAQAHAKRLYETY